MKRLLPLILLAGCATQPDIPGAVHVQAFGPNGSARASLHPETMREAQHRGLVIAYETGDVIDLSLHLDSNLAALLGANDLHLQVKRPVWLYSGPGGMWLSTNGTHFRQWGDAMAGSFSVGVGVHGDRRRNTANVRLEGNLAD